MSQEQMNDLFSRTKELVKDKDIKVITPCQVRTTSSTKLVTREAPTVIIIDPLSGLRTY